VEGIKIPKAMASILPGRRSPAGFDGSKARGWRVWG
jgi:hypothetical protein